MFTAYDKAVLVFYFVFILAVGWVFRRFVRNINDYFRGGGRVVWWMAGGSAFMVSFSAWTFTGAAGKAYRDGWPVLAIFLSNAVSLTLGGLYFGPKFRRLRVITPVQAIRERFGSFNEQVFTWLQIPIGTFQAGIWLNALAVFMAAALGLDLNLTLVATGAAVTAIALLGGAWSVVASDFIQVLILLPVCAVAAALSIARVGGWHGFVSRMPAGQLDLSQLFSRHFLAFWCVAILCKQFTYANNLMASSRYLCVKDDAHARKAGFLGAAFCLAGALLWFIPPMAAAIAHPNLGAEFPHLYEPGDASFVAMAAGVMPVGMLGLLASGIFAATMASADTGLNKNAGIFIKNFYQPALRPNASDRSLLVASKLCTLIMGLLMILVGWRLTTWSGISLFSLTVQFAAWVTVPISIPLLWSLTARKTPPWAGWSTLAVCLTVEILSDRFLGPAWAARHWGLGRLAPDASDYWRQASAIALNIVLGSAWFLGTRLFWKEPAAGEAGESDAFFAKLERPVDFESEIGHASDREQAGITARLCAVYGVFVLLLALIPNPPAGRAAFLFCGAVPLGVAAALIWSYRAKPPLTSTRAAPSRPEPDRAGA